MPRSVTIDPDAMRARGSVSFAPIPLNQYDRSIGDELSAGTIIRDDLIAMQRDMVLLRAFESMLNDVKKQGSHAGIEYLHAGAAHLSIGQEAAAVGQAFGLDCDDHIFGSHRSHSECLAKGLAAIARMDDDTLMRLMKGYFDGATLRVVEKDAEGSVQDLAIDFLLYGALAEIFGREAGFNKGLGGSMHVFLAPLGIYPNNAIVGGSAPIAVGASLFKHVRRRRGIVIANIGDAAAGCGPTWEALCFATMDQFKELWDESHRGGLPLIVNFVNNFYGMGGQPVGETMGLKVLARIGAGLSPGQLHAERVDGYNPLAVLDAIRRKKQIIEAGDGPVLLDTVTYRLIGHSPTDPGTYREKAEIEAWRECDPLVRFSADLIDAGVCNQSSLDATEARVNNLVLKAYRKAVDLDLSPRAELGDAACLLDRVMLSNAAIETESASTSEVLITKEQNARVQQLAKRSRFGLDAEGRPLSKQKCLTIRDALFEAILDRFHDDPGLIAFGEENRDWGGAFGVYLGLTESLPYHRLFNTPISEAAIIGAAVGYALEGGRALVELMYCDFIGRAGDELFNQLAKWQSMSGGALRLPVVVRVSVGSRYGAQHSQDWSSLCAHVPGLKVVFPATPYDAKGLMYSALSGSDPVIFFESQRLYDQTEWFATEGIPEGRFDVPIGEPDVKKRGRDLTILSIGATLYRALDAAERMECDHGISCEVIDARSIVPFNYEPVIESVRTTHRLMLTCDACERGSFINTMAAQITQLAFDDLDAPPAIVAARNWITPCVEQETLFFPQVADMLDAVHARIVPLKGYCPSRDASASELMRRSREGV